MGSFKIFNTLFYVGIAACLAMIWLPGYYLTGDGPCHVYNAQILHDLWAGKNTDFYLRYFEVLHQPNPNWFTTVAIALLLFVAKGVIAEKIFLTVYAGAYIGGVYALLKKLNVEHRGWLPAFFILIFTSTLTKGFYNFSFSIAFYFWVVWAWLSFMERKNFRNGVLFLLFVALTFFTHLLAFGLAALTCIMLALSFSVAQRNGQGWSVLRSFSMSVAVLFLFQVPFLFLMGWFMQKEGGLQVRTELHLYRIVELVQCKHLVNYASAEPFFTTIAGATLLVLACWLVLKAKLLLKVHKYDGLVYSLVLTFILYITLPDDLFGRAMDMAARMQLYVLALFMLVIAIRVPETNLKKFGMFVLFGCFLVLSWLRIDRMISISSAEKELMSVGKYIPPRTIVLPLIFSLAGNTVDGKAIADWNTPFRHAAQYIGVGKPLIVLDNYEANTGYFPIKWKDGVSPYLYFGKLEDLPPHGDIVAYKQKTGLNIDYILMWCYDDVALQNDDFHKFYEQLNEEYSKVYTSPAARVILYKKK